MPVRITRDTTLGDRIEKQFTKAKKKAGNKFKSAVIRDQKQRVKQQFPKSGKRRLAAIQGYVSEHGSHVTFKDFSPGAEAHEDGATIRPRNGKYLAVMTSLGYAGSAQDSFGRQQSDLRKLAASGQTFILKRGNRAILMRKLDGASQNRKDSANRMGAIEDTAHGKAFPIATLVKGVTLRARLGMTATVEKHFPAYARDIEDEIAKAD